MFGRRRPAAPNAALRPVVTYGTDPHGAHTFAALNSAAGRGLTGQRAVVRRGSTFSGWIAGPQQLTAGLANLGRGRPAAPATSTLDQEKSLQLTDPAQRIFYERMARRKR